MKWLALLAAVAAPCVVQGALTDLEAFEMAVARSTKGRSGKAGGEKHTPSFDRKRCEKYYTPDAAACEVVEACYVFGDPHVITFESDCDEIIDMKSGFIHLLYELQGVLKVETLVANKFLHTVYVDDDRKNPLQSLDTCNKDEVETKGVTFTDPSNKDNIVSILLTSVCIKNYPRKPDQLHVSIEISSSLTATAQTKSMMDLYTKLSGEISVKTGPGSSGRDDRGYCVAGSKFPVPIKAAHYFDDDDTNDYGTGEAKSIKAGGVDVDNCKKRKGPNGKQVTCNSNCAMFGDPHVSFFDRKCNNNIKCEFDAHPQPETKGADVQSVLMYEVVVGKKGKRRGYRAYGITDAHKRVIEFTAMYYIEDRNPQTYVQKFTVDDVCSNERSGNNYGTVNSPADPAEAKLDCSTGDANCILFDRDVGGFNLGVHVLEETSGKQNARRGNKRELDVGGIQTTIKCDQSKGAKFLNLCMERTKVEFLNPQNVPDIEEKAALTEQFKTVGTYERDALLSQGACIVPDTRTDYVPRYQGFTRSAEGSNLDRALGESWPVTGDSTMIQTSLRSQILEKLGEN